VTEPAAPPSSRSRSLLLQRWSPVLVLAYLLVGLAPYLMADWIPSDEGLLGQTAERVLQGELPHRDFDDTYTGGLAMLHAGAFKLLGISILSTRATLYAASWGFAGLLFLLGLRTGSRGVASLLALLGLSLGVARYFTSMPSWYNLFLGVAFLAALLRWRDTDRVRWLVGAGIAAGLSMTFKVIGIYLLPAGLLAILMGEWERARASGGDHGRGMLALKTAGLAAFVAALGLLVRARGDGADLVHFVLPGALLAGFLIHREWRAPGGLLRARLPGLLRDVSALGLGMALPMAAFLIPYRHGGVAAVFEGVFITPFARLDGVAHPMPPVALSLVLGLPLGFLLWRGARHGVSAVADRRGAWLALALGALALAFIRQPLVYQIVLLSTVQLLSFAVLAALPVAWRAERGFDVFAAAAVASMVALVEFPYWHPINSAYALPLVPVLIALLVATAGKSGLPQPVRTLGTAGAVYVALGAYALGPASDGFSRDRFVPASEHATALLALPRAKGIGVNPDEKRIYEQVVADIAAHSAPGDAIWAGPDSPDIYFLAERRNPTRTFYELFLDPETLGPRLLATLDEADVNVIVINRFPDFSRLPPELLPELRARFPHAADREWYEVRWRQQ